MIYLNTQTGEVNVLIDEAEFNARFRLKTALKVTISAWAANYLAVFVSMHLLLKQVLLTCLWSIN